MIDNNIYFEESVAKPESFDNHFTREKFTQVSLNCKCCAGPLPPVPATGIKCNYCGSINILIGNKLSVREQKPVIRPLPKKEVPLSNIHWFWKLLIAVATVSLVSAFAYRYFINRKRV